MIDTTAILISCLLIVYVIVRAIQIDAAERRPVTGADADGKKKASGRS